MNFECSLKHYAASNLLHKDSKDCVIRQACKLKLCSKKAALKEVKKKKNEQTIVFTDVEL